MTQRRNREDALQDILRRYGVRAENCVLMSSRKKFVAAAAGLGFATTLLGRDSSLMVALEGLAARLQEAG